MGDELEKIEKQFGERNKQVIQLETKLETARSRTQEVEQQLQQKSSDYEEMKVELSYSKVEAEQLQGDLADMKTRSDEIEARAQQNMINWKQRGKIKNVWSNDWKDWSKSKRSLLLSKSGGRISRY